jgi:hypothetical protein
LVFLHAQVEARESDLRALSGAFTDVIDRSAQHLASLQNPELASTYNSENSEPTSPGKTPGLLNPYVGRALLLLGVLVFYFS